MHIIRMPSLTNLFLFLTKKGSVMGVSAGVAVVDDDAFDHFLLRDNFSGSGLDCGLAELIAPI